MGRARLLQIRVQENSCVVPSQFKQLIDDCTATYESKKEEKNPFGKGLTGINSTDLTYDAFVYIFLCIYDIFINSTSL